MSENYEKYKETFQNYLDKGHVLRCPKCCNKLNLHSDYRTSLVFVCHKCKHHYKKPIEKELPEWFVKEFGKRRVVRDDMILTTSKIVKLLQDYEAKAISTQSIEKMRRNTALVAVLYLTGARISEIVGMLKPYAKRN